MRTRRDAAVRSAGRALFAIAGLLATGSALAAGPTCDAAERGEIPSFFGRRPSLSAAVAHETGSAGTLDENRASAALVLPRCEAGALTVAASRRERGRTAAQEVAAAYVRPIGPGLTVGVRGSYGPQGTLLPARAAGLTASWQFRPGWVLNGSVDRRRYENDAVIISQGSLDRYVGAWRFGAGVLASNLDGTSARLTGYVEASRGDADRYLTLRLLAGQEPEALPTGVQTRPIRGAVLVGRQAIGPDWALLGGVSLLDRGPFGRRSSAEIGVVRAF